MMRERERGFRLAEAVLGAFGEAPPPAFPRVAVVARAAVVEPPSALERDLLRLRRLPEGRAEAEIDFLSERRWLPA